jgi:cytochrome P450
MQRGGSEHHRLRGAVAAAFTPRHANRMRPVMRKTISRLLAEWAPKGAFDFAEFAAQFPVRVMCALIGASPDAVPSIKDALEVQGLSYSLDPSMLPAIEAAFETQWKFADQLVLDRQAEAYVGEDRDLLDSLLKVNAEGGVNDVELRDLLIFLIAAGYDTSKNLLTMVMYRMLSCPEYWSRCAEDRAFCDQVVEEVLRHSSGSNIYRTVSEEFVYRDITFPVGTNLIFPLSISGRDSRHFPDAMEIQPERVHTNRHIAFGRGIHICLGQYLARAQIEEGVHMIAQRITKPKLAGEVTWRPFPGVWGIRSLPIEFEPHAAREPKNSEEAQA